MQNRFFHESVAGTDRHAVAAGDAARFADARAAIPQNPRMGILPADGQSFVDLEILTSFDTTSAQNALVGIVAVERVGAVDFVGLGFEWETLVLHGQYLGGVVNDAVAVIVVADGAIEEVIAQNTIERFRSRRLRPFRRSSHGHVPRNRSRTGAHQLSIEFHKARVASLDGTELRVVA